jgi:hypothetical protein
MSGCTSRHKNHSCSLDADKPHEIHVELNDQGIMQARWRVVTEAVPNREVPDDE